MPHSAGTMSLQSLPRESPVVGDYAAHNAEQREMWAAYRRGEPTRVPIIFGVNPRYTWDRPDANPSGITWFDYWFDARKMLQRQLEHQCWIRHYLPADADMGLPEDGWTVNVNFQNTYEAAWLGCDVEFREGQVPDTRPLLADDADKYRLLNQGIPDPEADSLMGRMWDFYGYMHEQQLAGFEWLGRPIAHINPTGGGTDGPLTVACNLRGATQFLTDLVLDPGYAQDLLAYVTEAAIVRITAVRRRQGLPLQTQGWSFADDSVQLLSTPQYREWILPHHRRLLQTFSLGGPNQIHLCGHATHHFPTIREELNVQSFDTGFPVDFAWLRDTLGDEVEIYGGPSVPFLTGSSPAQIRDEVHRIFGTGITRGGRFVLREGNNLAAEVPLANATALYLAGREFGGY